MRMSKLNETELMLLALLKAYLMGEEGAFPKVREEDLPRLLQMAKRHHILPMVVDALGCDQTLEGSPLFLQAKMSALRQTAACVVRRQNFLKLMEKAHALNLHPLVMKGTICSVYYPSPACRLASDEDLLVREDEKTALCQFLQEEGFVLQGSESGEVESYFRSLDGLLLEVHTKLFPDTAEIYRTMNRFFQAVHSHSVCVTVESGSLYGFPPTECLLYLVCHLFKHFIHGGIGIRQFCDGLVYIAARSDEICWDRLLSSLREIRAEIFFVNLLAIGERYFDFTVEAVDLSSYGELVDPDDLLCDLLDAGVYGNDRGDRLHSGAITAQAVTDSGKRRKRILLFPSASMLAGRYPYLKKHPYLLPWAWLVRGLRYLKKLFKAREASPTEIMEMGNARIELLRKYKLL